MTLQEIYVHPLKSCRGNALPSATVEEMGLAHDRRWMLVTPEGKFLTGRQYPKLVLIEAVPDEDGITFAAPGQLALRVARSEMTEALPVEVWRSAFTAKAGSWEADFWFSDYLGVNCRLVHIGTDTTRRTNSGPPKAVGFADGYPVLLIGTASLDDLNGRLAAPVTMRHFRTNLVVKTDVPFMEDQWRRIRVGEVEFEVVKPCARCIFTTIDPTTAQADAGRQPLATLNDYRQVGDGTMFGVNLIALNGGRLNAGDPLTVLA